MRRRKVFDAIQLIDTVHAVRGQYAGYQDEPDMAPGSGTETLAAVRAEVDNRRWPGSRSSCAPASASPPAVS
jgi:glucose-6-phosphate 1-dehydrogenase